MTTLRHRLVMWLRRSRVAAGCRQGWTIFLDICYGRLTPFIALVALLAGLVWLAVIGAGVPSSATPTAPGATAPDSDPLRPVDLLRVGIFDVTNEQLKPSALDLLVGLVICVLIYRMWRLSAIAYRPGPVQIDDLVDCRPHHDPGVENRATAADLSHRLRGSLSVSAIATPITVPGGSEPISQLQSLGDAPDNAKWFGWATSLLLRVLPRFAYRITGAIHERTVDGKREFGISIQVQRMGWTVRARTGSQTLHWERSWDDAVDRAAHGIASFVIPRTRQARFDPWHGWRTPWYRSRTEADSITPSLVQAYSEAQNLSTQRRFDEALGRYNDVLATAGDDPTVRLELAAILERLNHAFDAIVHYHHACLLARVRGDRKIEGIATYRLGIMLGRHQEFIDDWTDPGGLKRDPARAGESVPMIQGSLRPKERNDLRPRVEKILHNPLAARRERFAELCDSSIDFCNASVAVLDELARKSRLTRNRLLRRSMDKPGIELAILWAEQRMEASPLSEPDQTPEPDQNVEERRHLTSVEDILGKLDRVLTTSKLRSRLRLWRARRRRRALANPCRSEQNTTPSPGERKGEGAEEQSESVAHGRALWQSHYNAACVAGIELIKLDTLFPPTVDPAPCDPCSPTPGAMRARLITFAVRQLENSILRPGSGFDGPARTWLLDEDPDLEAVRDTPEFRNLRAQYFPTRSVQPDRPGHKLVHETEANLYVTSLIASVARCREDRWHTLQQTPSVDIHDLMRWWGSERRLWQLVIAVCRDPRHWQTRLDLIRTSVESEAVPSLTSEYGVYDSLRLPDTGEAYFENRQASNIANHVWDVNARARAALEWLSSEPAGSEQLAVCLREAEILREFDSQNRRPNTRRQATERAAVWQRVKDVFELEDHGAFHAITDPACGEGYRVDRTLAPTGPSSA